MNSLLTYAQADRKLPGGAGSTLDWPLTYIVIGLIATGLVVLSSASIEFAAAEHQNPFYFTQRYIVYLLLALLCGCVTYQFSMSFWLKHWQIWLCLVLVLLLAVFVPGLGHSAKGSARWIKLGPLTLQCSEFAKILIILYMAGYLSRRQQEVRSNWWGFIRPMLVLAAVSVLLLKEPDFGATVVTLAVAFGMIFLAGVRFGQFFLVSAGALSVMVYVLFQQRYRSERIDVIFRPWDYQFEGGYQLTQALIAFGRGEWVGLGLGNSIQKLNFLPDAHTDFIFAIYAEEFGFIGMLLLLALYAALIIRIFTIARHAESLQQTFSAYVCYGIALMISGQVFINIGVNVGLLPTTGLTLPFFSHGGSSLMACCIAIALVLRIHSENQRLASGGAKKLHRKKIKEKSKKRSLSAQQVSL